ncbi:hypothetical protein SDC9_208364 [bioreactor metagenome]|uniref:Uncharacterized protein n=1 Tax=bioreactor metagenome TaxID=1076179 RepID=A0A645JAD7_9ZZZZ
MEQTAASIVRIKDDFNSVIAPDRIIMVFVFGEDLVGERLRTTETKVKSFGIAKEFYRC